MVLEAAACETSKITPATMASTSVTAGATSVSIVPKPLELRTSAGSYNWPREVRIAVASGQASAAAEVLSKFARSERHDAAVVDLRRPHDVALTLNGTLDPALGDEGYTATVRPEGVDIKANTGAGLFYGVQTLLQDTTADRQGGLKSRLIAVRDWPRFQWRGIHLDVSRHYFPLPILKRFIDVAARYKLNVFHWHLTDDEAWRLEIRHRPLLTERASCTAQGTDCGYYTQDMVRDLVAYASARHITIVPEIDIPGHSGAALRAYPYLSCSVGHQTVLCPTEPTFRFLDDVLTEVMTMFPGPFIHLGGDEVDVSQWRASPVVHDLMRSRGFTDMAQVVAFIRARSEQFLRARGRRIILWDDALAGPVGGDAVIVAWRGQAATMLAIDRGHQTIVNSDGPLYFDGYQGDEDREPSAMPYRATLQQVYRFEPIPVDASALQRTRVLGVQADLWTEQIATPSHLFYMLLPRELALAELAWTQSAQRSWQDFESRLPGQLSWLQENQYEFRIPDVSFVVSGGVVRFVSLRDSTQSAAGLTTANSLELAMEAPIAATIRYTTDGSVPTHASHLYSGPFKIILRTGVSARVSAAAFLASGERGPIETCDLRLVRRLPAGTGTYQSWSALIGSRRPGIYVPPKFP